MARTYSTKHLKLLLHCNNRVTPNSVLHFTDLGGSDFETVQPGTYEEQWN